MLSDAIKEPHDSMVRPVRVSFFDPRTGEPCDSRPEPLRREKGRETAEERNAAIAKRERDEKGGARDIRGNAEARGAEARRGAMAGQARGRPKRRQAPPRGRRRQAVPLRGGGRRGGWPDGAAPRLAPQGRLLHCQGPQGRVRRGLGVTRLRQWGERGIASGPALSSRSRPCGANLP